jgi:hypothetical protein
MKTSLPAQPNSKDSSTAQPGAEHQRLNVFVGRWAMSGVNKAEAPIAADAPVTGEENYGWLEGGFFLQAHFEHRFGSDRHTGVGIIGYDAQTGEYVSHNFDNLGYQRMYQLSVQDRVWTFTGEFERATLVFSRDGRSFTIAWEIARDGETWKPLCELKGTKVG